MAPAPQNPVSNPFAALLGKPSPRVCSPRSSARSSIGVNGYLSGVQALTGKFIQIGPDGSRTQGDFYISKPGRVRFEYDDPSPIELIADGSSVVVRDRRLATQDVYPLSQTPLRFLLADRVDLAEGHSPDRGLCRRCIRHRSGRGKKRDCRDQPADDHVQCQGHAAQAMDCN